MGQKQKNTSNISSKTHIGSLLAVFKPILAPNGLQADLDTSLHMVVKLEAQKI